MFKIISRLEAWVDQFNWFNILDEPPQEPQVEANGPACEHKRWVVNGWNAIGQGSCLDCHKAIGLDELLSGQASRLQELERRLEEKLGKAGEQP